MKITTRSLPILVTSILALGSLIQEAGAALVIGNIYSDVNSLQWTYIGDYNVGTGPAWRTSPPNYSAIQAAAIAFGPPQGSSVYAISTSDTFVDHLAWYDGFGTGSHLPAYNTWSESPRTPLAENFFSDIGVAGYTESGDYSAHVGEDRAALGGGAFNHVFVSVSAIPEPGSMMGVAMVLGSGALIRTRRRRAL